MILPAFGAIRGPKQERGLYGQYILLLTTTAVITAVYYNGLMFHAICLLTVGVGHGAYRWKVYAQKSRYRNQRRRVLQKLGDRKCNFPTDIGP